ncbi:MAG: copper homeostasis protein CutC [Robiginitalea sp.]
MKIEVCVTSVADARIAEKAGVDRLELCSELAVGGVTPSPGLLEAVRGAVQIPVHVLIRPRSGDFTYPEEVFTQMLFDIDYCRGLGYEGFATGCLLPDGRLDQQRMKLLAEAVGPAHLTFHRAFDRLADWKEAVPQLEALGVQTILSSGQAPAAVKGLPLLEQLAARTHCGIMPGGGIRPENVHQFTNKGFEAIHLSAISSGTPELFAGPRLNTPSLLREGSAPGVDPGILDRLVTRLKSKSSG